MVLVMVMVGTLFVPIAVLPDPKLLEWAIRVQRVPQTRGLITEPSPLSLAPHTTLQGRQAKAAVEVRKPLGAQASRRLGQPATGLRGASPTNSNSQPI